MAHIPNELLGIGKISNEKCDVSFSTKENFCSPLHTHPTTNFVLVTEGALLLTLNGATSRIGAGEWCVIPAHAEHAEKFEGKSSVLVFWLKQAAQLNDWDPRSDNTLKDQIAAYDAMRRRCPVAHSDYLGYSLFRHADVMRVLSDHQSFSNRTSSHLSVPNGMDPPEHGAYRDIIDPYFSQERMDAFEPVCRSIARQLVQRLQTGAEVDVMAEFATDFALQLQSAFMGWPTALHEPLKLWVQKNRAATLAKDKKAATDIAFEFDGYIRDLLATRRQAGDQASADITTGLLREQAGGRPLNDEEIISIVRNWTVGELSTISASIGILVHYLATHPDLQRVLREQESLLPVSIDEILRIHPPLIANKRINKVSVNFDGYEIPPGSPMTLLWASANRDESVFGDPDEFRLDRDPAKNLLYGAGIHVCPGAPLARLELRVLMEELLRQTRSISLSSGTDPTRAIYPASGFNSLTVKVE